MTAQNSSQLRALKEKQSTHLSVSCASLRASRNCPTLRFRARVPSTKRPRGSACGPERPFKLLNRDSAGADNFKARDCVLFRSGSLPKQSDALKYNLCFGYCSKDRPLPTDLAPDFSLELGSQRVLTPRRHGWLAAFLAIHCISCDAANGQIYKYIIDALSTQNPLHQRPPSLTFRRNNRKSSPESAISRDQGGAAAA